MKIIDVVFLFFILSISLGLIFVPKRMNGFLKPLTVLTCILAIGQFLLEGYYWQYLPSYLLILIFILLLFKKTDNTKQRTYFRIALFFLILVSIVPWTILLPIPKLIEPQGNFKVGTRIFRWIDFKREEQITSDQNDKRNVVVQAWYPTEQNAKGRHSSYLDGMENFPEKIGILPNWIVEHYDQVNTHGILNAPIAKTQSQWPVILFLPGNGASRAFYTSLVSNLASQGYVVLSIDHPYEAMFTQLANGQIVTTIEDHGNDPDLTDFMIARLNTRVADIQFVIDQLGNPEGSPDNFLASLDPNRIVITGHSLGGATAAVAMAIDSRIKAAVNIDGTLYGDLPKSIDSRPFLLFESNKADSDRYLRYENGNQKIFKHFGNSFRYEMPEADHYSFTDVPMMLAFPTRFLAGHFLEIGNIPTRTHNATVEILTTFFHGALNDQLSNLDSVIGGLQGIIRKPID